jgi:hypothetical protein
MFNNIDEFLNEIIGNLHKEKLFDDPFYEEDIVHTQLKKVIISKGDNLTEDDIELALKEAKCITISNTLNSLSDKGLLNTLVNKEGDILYACSDKVS